MSVFIIAEAGVNHNGSLDIAKKLISAAASAGADAVKFQTFSAKRLVTKTAKKTQYQKENTNSDSSQFDMLKKLEIDVDFHKELITLCIKKNIIFMSTPFDRDSIDLLFSLGVKIFKIGSGEINNLPYLRHIGALKTKVILSTGMSSLSEVQEAMNILIESGARKEDITILHANTMYPTPMEDVNLNAMLTMKKQLGVSVGYSDHTLGIEVDIAAVALGAQIIEKHFTISNKMKGPDHKASLEPNQLKEMVVAIRNIEKALGSFEKKPSPSETININIVRKSIVASKAIKKGDLFTETNIVTKRPGDGMSPMMWDKVIGSFAKKDYKEDEQI